MKALHLFVPVLLTVLCGRLDAQLPGQRPAPHIGFVYPAGGQQGTTFRVTVGGQNLNGSVAAYFSGTGIAAQVIAYDRPLTQKELNDLREKLQQLQEKRTAARQPNAPAFTPEDERSLEEVRKTLATRGARPANPALAESVTLEVTLAPDAAVGTRDLRVKAAAGLSNAVVFCISALPETTAPVVTATSAPARPNAAAPRPRLVSESAALVPLPAILNGQILAGEVDRYRFAGRKGQRLTIATAARALIPYLADAVPGWFQATLAVFDKSGREIGYADDYRFNPDPVVLCELPADGEYVIEIKDAIYRGREDFVYRIAIGELPFVTAIFPLGGTAGHDHRVAASGWNLARQEFVLDTMDRGRGTMELTARDGSSFSNSMRFSLDDRPALLEAEPNNTLSEAQPVNLPLTIDGRVGARGDADFFQFRANAGDVIAAEVQARRLNSPLDSILEVFDQDGKRIAHNDDCEDKGAGLLTHHADSRVQLKLPATGTYFVRIGDTQRHGGSDFSYRLRVGPPEPDFALRIAPSTINVRGGGTIMLTAYALRRDGFDGEILLALKDAPRGFVLSGARIPSGQDSVRLTLTAPPVPFDEPATLSVLGVASDNGRRIVHAAIPAEDQMQAFAYRHLVPSQELRALVMGRSASLRVTSPLPAVLPAGGVVKIRVTTPVARAAGDVKLELVEPPAGIRVLRCETGQGYTDVFVACDAAQVKPGTQGNLLFHALTERRGGSDKKIAPKLQRNALGLVPAVPFNVVAASPST